MLLKIVSKIRFGFISKTSIVAIAATLPMLMSGVAAADPMYCNYDGNNGDGYCLMATGSNSSVLSCDYQFGGGCSTSIGAESWGLWATSQSGVSEMINDNWGNCIGDLGNASGNASAGLDVCPTASSNPGWGTRLLASNCSNPIGAGFQLYDIHWNGFIGPQAWGNNQKEYLNKPTAWCFAQY
ncbi:MAG TPA: hypothetical protein VLG47_05375 [Candidatus Saccharimonadales bacterium]|nr:hypothetical protein [Candidatus Saccharimonadales bacterium]